MSIFDMKDSTSALIELFKLQSLLQEKLCELQCFISADSHMPREKEIKHLLKEQIDVELNKTEQQLIDVQIANADADRVAQMALSGQEAFKSVYSSKLNVNKEDSSFYNSLQNKISTKFDQLRELNTQFLSKEEKLHELEFRLESVKKNLQEIQWQNREAYALLAHAESQSDSRVRQQRAEESHAKTRELKKSLENSLKELKLRREILLALIQAAKIDWFDDDELRNVVLELGEPLRLEPS